MDSGSTHLHVVPSLDGGWVLRDLADGPAVRRTRTQRGVLDHATFMLADRQGGEIEVHDVDGTVTERYEVAARGMRPWWYRRPSPTAVIGPLLLSMVAVAWLLDPTTSIPRWIVVLVLAPNVLSVAFVIASWRLDRRAVDPTPTARGRGTGVDVHG